MKKVYLAIAITLILASISICGCAASTTTITKTEFVTPPTTPEYHTVEFTLNSANQYNYSFPIYLLENQTLHFFMTTDSSEKYVWTHILSPSGKQMAARYERSMMYFDNMGITMPLSNFNASFNPSDNMWEEDFGEGYFRVECVGDSSTASEIIVDVEYWIQN